MTLTRKTTRRHLIQVLALAATMASGAAMAQAWPNKPISLIVPFPAGGTTDVLARALAEKLQQSLGQPVIVESKPGAGATLGADYVVKSKPDGYTLLVGAVHHTIASSVYKKLPYDFQKDLTPITTIALVPNVLVGQCHDAGQERGRAGRVAKAQPGKHNYGSNGNGTAQHLIGTQFENMTGTQLRPHPLQGQRPAGDRPARRPDHDVLRHRDAGAAAHQGRQAAPAGRDHGEALFRAARRAHAGRSWPEGLQHRHLVRRARAGGHAQGHRRARLNTEMVKIIQSPEFRKRMGEIGAEPIGNSTDQMAAADQGETEKFAKLVKDAKVVIE
jgi:tripartite-type tricarboxylate transporter receptor subunit TctC